MIPSPPRSRVTITPSQRLSWPSLWHLVMQAARDPYAARGQGRRARAVAGGAAARAAARTARCPTLGTVQRARPKGLSAIPMSCDSVWC